MCGQLKIVSPLLSLHLFPYLHIYTKKERPKTRLEHANILDYSVCSSKLSRAGPYILFLFQKSNNVKFNQSFRKMMLTNRILDRNCMKIYFMHDVSHHNWFGILMIRKRKFWYTDLMVFSKKWSNFTIFEFFGKHIIGPLYMTIESKHNYPTKQVWCLPAIESSSTRR
jgi:hypothetical protein